ncbi:MAG: class I SAM-dependent methyltransferase, partial [Proteobacteria bacterium]
MTLALNSDYMFHAHMLGDKARLQAYRRALKEKISPGDSTVEIGSGTGILSLIAADLGAARVDAIEYFGDLCALARTNANGSAGLKPEFHHASSFEWKSDGPITGIFSETIGSWGPEENIVEIFADFVSRNSGAKWLMPSRLRLFSQEISSDAIVRDQLAIAEACASAAEVSGREFAEVEKALNASYHSQLQCSTFQERELIMLTEPSLVKEYHLGRDRSSRFENELTIRSDEANGLHLWFEAELSEGENLSSHFGSPITHW